MKTLLQSAHVEAAEARLWDALVQWQPQQLHALLSPALFLTDHEGQRQDASPLLAGWNARRIRIAAIERQQTEQLACGAMVLVTGELRIHLDGEHGRQLHTMRLLRVWTRSSTAPGVHLLSMCVLPASPPLH
ncbi:nuclear transport factor 2 family protein [Stenotrophomonas sp. SAM-B]|uniref:nuclear transport factor 2 family protein n=1 Tax=Stenotrophomonas sp. SAM-B TaxID=2729141 RepID=UPI0015A26A24|nr:nuclear transport factor 2 family protein [Stenotrophomonas sp. SAM-B]NWF32920.1 nuclear transport factor 2 family protein [Stenotrophomonas sp. SAM-B]